MADVYSLPQIEALNVQTATAALQQGVAAIQAGHTVFDLAGIQSADSSAVAVLLEWQRCARRAGTALSFVHIPASLCSLARLYGVDAFLVDTPAGAPVATDADLHHH